LEYAIALVGRICLAFIFLLSAYGKISLRQFHLDAMKGVGVPLCRVALPLAVAIDLIGAASILSGLWLQYVVPPLIVYVGICTAFFYRGWFQKGKFEYMTVVEFTKNLALVGGLLLLLVTRESAKWAA